jgi:hypothetical protein
MTSLETACKDAGASKLFCSNLLLVVTTSSRIVSECAVIGKTNMLLITVAKYFLFMVGSLNNQTNEQI